MNTFLPYASFLRSARILDRARLGKQRIECVQLLKALASPDAGYQNHPCTRMWRGHDRALAAYGLTMCNEWMVRGYTDTQHQIILDFFPFERPEQIMLTARQLKGRDMLPWWFGWSKFHESHRSNLIRKAEDWYVPRMPFRFIPADGPRLPYVWPSDEPRVFKRQHSKDSPYYVKLSGYSSAPPTSRSQ